MLYPKLHRSALFLIFGVSLCSELSSDLAANETFSKALQEVNAQAPQQFDPIVTPLPEEGDIEEAETLELLKMLESWNPALRSSAARALGSRGDEAMPALLHATRSENGTVRAGATSALEAIIKQKLKNWKEVYPDMNNGQEAQEKILSDHEDLEEAFIRLTKDPRLDVRVSALAGLSTMAPQTAEAAEAVLALCADENEYLAQDAMIQLDKRFGVSVLQEEKVIEALKLAMRSPLPRGRGHVLNVIQKMDESSQRRFIPEMLAHLDWQPNRDTMFGAGGQADSVKLLTKFRVKELVPRLPGLMEKSMRGPGLFDPCLESAKAFGRDAKIILPELREKLAEMEKENVSSRHRESHAKRMNKIKETIAYIEKQ